MSKRHHMNRPVFGYRSKAFGEPDQRTGKAALNVVDTKAFQAYREINCSSNQNLQQGDSQKRRRTMISSSAAAPHVMSLTFSKAIATEGCSPWARCWRNSDSDNWSRTS